VTELLAFGSIVGEDFDPAESDVDLWVFLEPMPPLERGEYLLQLWDELEDLFERKVDLISQPEIQNPYLRASIERSKVKVYDRNSKEIWFSDNFGGSQPS
jgi:predicted nucleotidyltransferase